MDFSLAGFDKSKTMKTERTLRTGAENDVSSKSLTGIHAVTAGKRD